METKGVAVKESSAVDTMQTPRRGFECGVDRTDLIIPRAKLLQALSPEVVENPREFFPGTIINSLTKEEMPAEFVPIFLFVNWIRFNPKNDQDAAYDPNFEPGAIIWRSNDPLDPRVKKEGEWDGDKAPLATKFLNFFSIFPGVDMPVIVSFSKTSYKTGKRLLSLAQFGSGDMFSRKYKLAAKQTKNDLGTFFVLSVDPAGRPTDEVFKSAEKLWLDFATKAKDIQVHEEASDPSPDSDDLKF